jgi:hypothetical protein
MNLEMVIEERFVKDDGTFCRKDCGFPMGFLFDAIVGVFDDPANIADLDLIGFRSTMSA